MASSTLYGEIEIDPPLSREELVNSPLDNVWEIVFVTEGSSATRIIPGTEEEAKFYDLAARLAAVAERYGASHRFIGQLVEFGPEPRDIARYVIDGTEVREQRVISLAWPDGSSTNVSELW